MGGLQLSKFSSEMEEVKAVGLSLFESHAKLRLILELYDMRGH